MCNAMDIFILTVIALTLTIDLSFEQVNSGGDVHITTIDGVEYDFNGHGEYVFLKAKEFEIQARTDYVIPGNIQSTMFTAFVIHDWLNNDQIEFHLNMASDTITVYRNGTEICNNSIPVIRPCAIPPRHKCFIIAGKGIVVVQGCSLGMFFRQIKFSSRGCMDISLDPGRNLLPNSGGLAGNADYGFLFRNGTLLPNNSAEPDIFQFGESWTLQNETESHFNYSISGESYSFYNENHTVPKFFETLLEKLFNGWSKDNITLFNTTCRTSWDNKQIDGCLLAIARTGELAFGKAVIADIEEEHRRWLILHNKPPVFLSTMPDRIVVLNHQTYTLYIPDFVDDEDKSNLRYNVTTGIPKNEFDLSVAGNFTWRVGTALRYFDTRLVFYVVDSFNATHSHEVKISYCGCEAIEECDVNLSSRNSTYNVERASCNCPKYHSGDYCEIIIDACTEFNCNISCNSSVPQTFASWPCTPCPQGTTDLFRGGTQECLDIDECFHGDDMCHQLCTNTYGSFLCNCRSGYVLNADNHTCNDIDECMISNNGDYMCEQLCTNTYGSFFCNCSSGYILNDDKHTCNDIDECMISNHGDYMCEQFCTNTDGSFFCNCSSGYILDNDMRTCNALAVTTTPSVNNKTLMCFACDETFSPSFCEVVKSCEDNQLCFLEKISTPEGNIHFKSGCRSREICDKHQYNTGDGCFECCHGSFCNSRGCGELGYTARGSRGPLCLECARVNAPQNCDQIKLCSSNQMCFIDELAWGDNSLFHLGCRNIHQCAADGIVVRSLPTCSTCCDDDYCNVKCRKQETVIPLIG